MSAASDSDSDEASSVWPVVSKSAAALIGSFIVTYWTGAAFAKCMVLLGILQKTDAGLATGFFQLTVFTVAVLWIAAVSSQRKVWIGIAAVTALSIAIVVLTPGFTRPDGAAATSADH